MRPFGMSLIASAKPLGRQRMKCISVRTAAEEEVEQYRPGAATVPAPLHLSSVYGVAHSALAKRPKKNPRRAARRSHRLSNCAKVNLSGVRAAGRFFAMARVGSAAGLLAVVTIAV